MFRMWILFFQGLDSKVSAESSLNNETFGNMPNNLHVIK